MTKHLGVRWRGIGLGLVLSALAVEISAACGGDEPSNATMDAAVDVADAEAGADQGAIEGPRDAAVDARSDTSVPSPDRIALVKLNKIPVANPIEVEARLGQIYFAEQRGLLRVLSADGTLAPTALDLSMKVTVGYDEGVTGFALHPKFPLTPYVYVSYTAPAPIPSPPSIGFKAIIARFETKDGGATFDPTTEKVILSFDHPGKVHNNGCLVFGPDGYLYIGSGKGDDPADPQLRAAQLTSNLLGKILRINVDLGDPYSIPPTNPYFAMDPGERRPEIFALGLRNPWRFGFDGQTGRLWAGDVGEATWEEINEIHGGGNYGWANREGRSCFADAATCDGGFVEPLIVHAHAESTAIVGGVFYHGAKIPWLAGKYVYADAQSSLFWMVDPNGVASDDAAIGPLATPSRIMETVKAFPVSLRLDAAGEIIGASYTGMIFRVIGR